MKRVNMGSVYAEITLINSDDVGMAKRNLIGEDEIKQLTVRMLVDSGAYMMGINQTIQKQLGLSFIEKRKVTLADGSVREYDVVGPIIVKFKNRTAICSALVIDGNIEPLLGAIPLEEMPACRIPERIFKYFTDDFIALKQSGRDVIIHPQRQELIVNPEHPYSAQLNMKRLHRKHHSLSNV